MENKIEITVKKLNEIKQTIDDSFQDFILWGESMICYPNVGLSRCIRFGTEEYDRIYSQISSNPWKENIEENTSLSCSGIITRYKNKLKDGK
jgi:hypothetical protein